MDMDTALAWVIALAGMTVTFLIGVYTSNRMYKAGYINGYLDALDERWDEPRDDWDVPSFT